MSDEPAEPDCRRFLDSLSDACRKLLVAAGGEEGNGVGTNSIAVRIAQFAHLVSWSELIKSSAFAAVADTLPPLLGRNSPYADGNGAASEQTRALGEAPPLGPVVDPEAAFMMRNVHRAVEAAPFGLELATEKGSVTYWNRALGCLFAQGEPLRTIWAGREPWSQDIRHLERHGASDLFIEFDLDGEREPKCWRIPESHRRSTGDSSEVRVLRFAETPLVGTEHVATWVVDATRTEMDRQYLEQSLDAANALQKAIFRTDEAKLKLPHFHYDTLQKQTTGGDFIFGRRLSGTRDLLVVGDCFGKGVFAALVTAIVGMSLQRWLLSDEKKEESARDLLLRIDNDIQRYLYRINDHSEGHDLLDPAEPSAAAPSESDDTFSATGLDALAIIVDRKEKSIEFAIAGGSISGYLVRRKKNKVTRLKEDEADPSEDRSGPRTDRPAPLGSPYYKGLGTLRVAGERPVIGTGRRKNLNNRDKIVVFTDGLEVQLGPSGRARQEQLGRKRIERIFEEKAAQGPGKLLEELVALWRAHRGAEENQTDDMALAVLEFRHE